MASNVTETSRPSVPAAPPGFTDSLVEPFTRLRGEIDRLFQGFPLRVPAMRFGADFAVAVPALEMTETSKEYKITAELPGIDIQDVELNVEDDMLRIAGEKKTEREEDEKGYHLAERSYGAFERLVRLPAAAQSDKIKAKCKDGVLTITIPKDGETESRTRRIAIEQG